MKTEHKKIYREGYDIRIHRQAGNTTKQKDVRRKKSANERCKSNSNTGSEKWII